MINDFFKKLSERMNKENNLSDITWSLISVDSEFKNLFLEYCFEEKIVNVEEIIREYSVGESRPDFYFRDTLGNEYLIEVKIYDKNMHFAQYNKSFPRAKKSFIANYGWKPEEGFFIKTWKGFIILLQERIKIADLNHSNLMIGYIDYLKSVTNYVEVNKMNISNLDSIYSFHQCISESIQEFSMVKLELYNQAKPYSEYKYGRFAYFKNNKGENIYLWYGLYFCEVSGVYIEFDYKNKYWVPKHVSDKLKLAKMGEYSEAPEYDESSLWFRLSNKYYLVLQDEKSNIEDQKSIIDKFLEEVILNIK